MNLAFSTCKCVCLCVVVGPAMVILLSVCGVAAVLLLCLCVCLCKCFVCTDGESHVYASNSPVYFSHITDSLSLYSACSVVVFPKAF